MRFHRRNTALQRRLSGPNHPINNMIGRLRPVPLSAIATGTIRINVTPRSVLEECLYAGSARKFELVGSHIGSLQVPLAA